MECIGTACRLVTVSVVTSLNIVVDCLQNIHHSNDNSNDFNQFVGFLIITNV